MTVQALATKIKNLTETVEKLQSRNYSFSRDQFSNLIIKFQNDQYYKMPRLQLRPYQLEVQHNLYIEECKRFFLVRPRRAGKEVESWNMLIQGAMTRPGLYLMIYPTNVRARLVLWDGSISFSDGRSLKFLDMIPKAFVLGKPKQDTMTIHLINGSVIRVLGSDIEPDKLRGVNVLGAVFSEYAFADPRVLQILMPVFRQNGGWYILQTTFNGMNHAYKYFLEIQKNPAFYWRKDTVETLIDEHGNRYITDEMIDEDRKAGMPEWLIQQEYYSEVNTNQETLYFSAEIKNLLDNDRIRNDIIIPNRKTRIFLDIGMNDKTAVTIAQLNNNGEPHVIGYFEDNNKSFEYYIRLAEGFCVKHGLILDSIYVPHDGQKRDFSTGKNTVDFGRDLGYRVYVVPKPTSKINAIQSMRRLLYRTHFDDRHTKRLIECLSNYSKEYDEKMGIYKDLPRHDWACHGVDSYQTLTLAIETSMLIDKTHDIIYINN